MEGRETTVRMLLDAGAGTLPSTSFSSEGTTLATVSKLDEASQQRFDAAARDLSTRTARPAGETDKAASLAQVRHRPRLPT